MLDKIYLPDSGLDSGVDLIFFLMQGRERIEKYETY